MLQTHGEFESARADTKYFPYCMICNGNSLHTGVVDGKNFLATA
jgi:hypothetical protein